MKKYYALLLAILLAFTITACKNGGENLSSDYEDVIVETIKPDADKSDKTDSISDASTTDSTATDSKDKSTTTQTTTTTTSTTSQNTSKTTSSNTDTNSKHTHSYSDATCTAPATCSCGAVSGKKADHTWQAATCKAPKTCTVCNTTKGSKGSHDYEDGACTACGTIDVNSLMGRDEFVGNFRLSNGSLTASGITLSDRSAGGLNTGIHGYLSTVNFATEPTGLKEYKHNGTTYYYKGSEKIHYEIEIADTEIIFKNKETEEYSGTPTLKLTLVNGDLKVTYSNHPDFPVDTIFTINW